MLSEWPMSSSGRTWADDDTISIGQAKVNIQVPSTNTTVDFQLMI